MQEVLQIYTIFHEIMTLVIYLPLENEMNVFLYTFTNVCRVENKLQKGNLITTPEL